MQHFITLLVCLLMGAASFSLSASAATLQTGSSAQSVEQVTPATDKNPIVGEIKLGDKIYKVHKGQKGGFYVWRIRTRGAKQGEPYKYYPNKEERKSIRFYNK